MTTDAQSKRISLEVQALHDHFASDLRREKRNRLAFIIVSVILIGAVFGYMSWLHEQLKKTITPKEIAEFVANNAVSQLPALGDELSRSLKQAAPELVEELKKQFIEEALPELRKFGEDQLLDLSSQAIEVAEQQMVDTITAVIQHNKAAILADATTESTVEPVKLAAALDAALQLELKKRLSDKPGESLSQQLDSSKQQLRAINAKLHRLSTKKDLTRVETLERRLLQSWTTFLDQQAREL